MRRKLHRATERKVRIEPALLLACGLLASCADGAAGPEAESEARSIGSGSAPSNSDSTGGGSATAPGSGGEGGDGSGGGAVTGGESCADVVGESVLRRLSRVEYQLTLQDLFQLSAPPEVEEVPPDVQQEGFTSYADIQTISPAHLRSYIETATTLIDDVLGDEERIDHVIGCELSTDACLEEFVQRFGRLAYRRTLEANESAALAARAKADSSSLEDSFRYATQVLLSSPHFIFRVEVGDQSEGLSQLSGVELASKLSFSFWGRAPSSTLLDRAESGELATAMGFSKVATEMLLDEKTKSFYSSFFTQWLGYEKLRAPTEPSRDWNDDFLDELKKESDDLLSEFAWTPDTDFLGILTATHTYLSDDLADYYDLPEPEGASGLVEIPEEHPRATSGVLTHGALISAKGDGDLVSIRGNWLRRTFLCLDLVIPPSVADTLGELLVGLNRIQIIEKRNEERSCAGCHSRIDPIGIGYAAFDQSGRFDDSVDLSVYPVEAGFPDHNDPPFSTIGELSAKLAEMPEVAACLAERSFLFSAGRQPTKSDSCTLETVVDSFEEKGNVFNQLLRSLIEDESFRFRRAPQL